MPVYYIRNTCAHIKKKYNEKSSCFHLSFCAAALRTYNHGSLSGHSISSLYFADNACLRTQVQWWIMLPSRHITTFRADDRVTSIFVTNEFTRIL
ncbi:hypothetical protein JTE90_020010 [Oedothorax gibbosus]|uniref:Uncharacterized protein n=1 Tax=Oedothorax gibbosus TaxID=931172 RepID=A0AAV6UMQ2_9ARAC|nr:hypothetical protein JTE90_020010 [Oedothorax gibbosus]